VSAFAPSVTPIEDFSSKVITFKPIYIRVNTDIMGVAESSAQSSTSAELNLGLDGGLDSVAAGRRAQRQDLQVLRGIAVLLVVFYHSRLGITEAGYLGVDVFFVSSGFLITSMIKSQMECGRFSFREFYFRRAK
jgi:hypothetical protein